MLFSWIYIGCKKQSQTTLRTPGVIDTLQAFPGSSAPPLLVYFISCVLPFTCSSDSTSQMCNKVLSRPYTFSRASIKFFPSVSFTSRRATCTGEEPSHIQSVAFLFFVFLLYFSLFICTYLWSKTTEFPIWESIKAYLIISCLYSTFIDLNRVKITSTCSTYSLIHIWGTCRLL